MIIDQHRSKGPRTRVLLVVSILYASIFACGVVISISEILVVLLLPLGVFILSYLTVYPRALNLLFFATVVYVVAIATPYEGITPTLTLAGVDFLLFFAGGLWAIVGGMIFLARKTSKQQRTVTADPFQKQHQPKLTWQDKFRPLTSNLSVHSQYFQYAIVFTITVALVTLIVQWFKLPEGAWVLITVVVLLLHPAYFEISLTLKLLVRRIIGTTIGAVIAIIIIANVQNIWLLTLFFIFFASAFTSFMKIKNYAFLWIFMTTTILLLFAIIAPTADPTASLERIQNTFIGCVLSLLACIWITLWRKKSNLRLMHKGE